MGNTLLIYDQVLEVTQDYLGPATKRFIDRQIDAHLHKKPHELTKDDMDKLTEWLKVSIAMLAHDKSLVDDYVQSLKNLHDDKSIN